MQNQVKVLLLTFLSLSSIISVAQKDSSQIILYKDFFFLSTRTNFDYNNYQPRVINDYGYAIAYQTYKADRKYRHVEVKFHTAQLNSSANESNVSEIQLSHRRGKYWKNKLFNAIHPKHHLTYFVNYLFENTAPLVTTQFPTETTVATIGIDYTLGLEIPFSQKINLILDCTIVGISFSWDNQMVENPTLTLRQQQQGGFSFNTSDQTVLKIGLGIKL